MSKSAGLTLTWGDGEHTFRLAIGQLRELQDKCKAGPNTILRRLVDGSWFIDDIRETLRLGLIGGGKKPVDAAILTARYIDDRPPMENVLPAQAVLMTALVGDPADPVGETTAETTMTEEIDPSSSRQSMDLEPQ